MSGRPSSVLDKYLGGVAPDAMAAPASVDAQPTDAASAVVESAAFAEHAVPVAMLDFEQADGTRMALPYHHLNKATLEGGATLTLMFSDEVITITGRRLEPLYRAILGHRAGRISADGQGGFDTGHEPVVIGIDIRADT